MRIGREDESFPVTQNYRPHAMVARIFLLSAASEQKEEQINIK